MHGHKIHNISTSFVTLYTDDNDFKVSATFYHWIYVCENKDCDWNNAILKRFGNVKVNC